MNNIKLLIIKLILNKIVLNKLKQTYNLLWVYNILTLETYILYFLWFIPYLYIFTMITFIHKIGKMKISKQK